uniref:Adaptor-related protein complex 5, zeta 1 subunit n=1 Tax=Mus musculus TaxID=10090 RepID=A0A0G2JEH7_MOUSE
MFSAGAESLLHQAREIQDEELRRFCSRVTKLLQEAPGPATVDALQRLFLIVSATKYPRRSCVPGWRRCVWTCYRPLSACLPALSSSRSSVLLS